MRITKLKEKLNNETMILSDPTSIYYFTGYKVDPGLRLFLLVLQKDKEPYLILNDLFPRPQDIDIISYKDGDDTINLLQELFKDEQTLYIDGTLPARFLIPMISKNKTFIDGSSIIESLRRIKDAKEIETLKQASKYNDDVMASLLEHFKEGISEKELADIIKEKQSTDPLTGISFEPISVFTENIADPHAIPGNRTLQKGDVILIDMGGTYQNYKSDMTRAFFYGKNPELEKIYDIVLEANLKAIEAVKVGIPLKEVDKAARDVITKHGYGEYFIHRTGHGIGLDTHENLDVSSTNETLIEEGMCFSIEPGIYIEGVGGIRIEDLVCVENGQASVMNHFTKDKTYL